MGLFLNISYMGGLRSVGWVCHVLPEAIIAKHRKAVQSIIGQRSPARFLLVGLGSS
jgi:hypothetical protein